MTEPGVSNVTEVAAQLRPRAEASGLPVIDLAQGTPTDPTPGAVRDALAAAADAPGYPTAHGSRALREAYSDWAHRRFGAALDPQDVIATLGSKEFIATLPLLLGLGPSDTVVIPELAYPTYRVGAATAGCRVVVADSTLALGPQRVAVLWVNTPANPTGKVLPAEHLAKVVAWARERGTLVVSDECYIELGDPALPPPASILSPEVSRGSVEGLLAVHSLSKRSSMAGYRSGFVSGDSAVLAGLLRRRRDMGLLVPAPVQAAAAAALADDESVFAARDRYTHRRHQVRTALTDAGFTVEHSEAGLFCWATRGEPDTTTTAWLADRGVIAAPGSLYGPTGAAHVRLALTAPDDQLGQLPGRLR